MDWIDDGLVLAAREHGEAALIVTLLTRERGRHAGFVHGGGSSRQRPIWQLGNRVRAEWRGRLADQLGTYKGETRAAYGARALDDALCLSGLAAACATIDAVLPEREPHPAVFAGFDALLSALGYDGWPSLLVRLEVGLLQELGFALDLASCAATGATDDLAYVSPKSGRAVCRAAAEPHKAKLLPLPPFLAGDRAPPPVEDVVAGLDLTGYFLERHVFWPRDKPLPPPRERFIDLLRRGGGVNRPPPG